MIDLKKLSHGFLRKSLFSNVTLRLMVNERYGIVGANGCGKSTLLKIISGEIEPDDGEVEIETLAKVFRIGQDFYLNDDEKIIDTAMMGNAPVFQAVKRQEQLLAMVNSDPKIQADISAEMAELEEIISRNDGYRLKARSLTILEGLGILSSQAENTLKTLSGGYQWRVYLAQALIKNPDVLMLDEPTNHLDIVSIRWLELFLQSYLGTVLIVSHDRRFLEQVCTKILDVDFDTITEYTGNYSAFDKARRLFLLQKEKEILAQQKEVARKQEFVDRFRAKATKARQAQSRLKQIEKIVIEEPLRSSRVHPHLRFDLAEPGSKEVLEVKNLRKAFGEKIIINNFSLSAKRGDKIAIIGPNGSGKSTLIKALAQEFPECDKFIKWGHGVSLGYFAQDCGKKIKVSSNSVLEWLWQFCADKAQSYVQGLLGRVLFTGEDAKKATKELSGGELSRLYLAYLMLQKPNVLLLDEPTNHLDLESIESLSNALINYSGTLITVSHDRAFIDQIFQRIIELTPQGVQDFLGTYSEFVEHRERDFLDAKQESAALKNNSKQEISISKLSYEEQKARKAQTQKLKKQLEKIMLQVEETEERVKNIEEQFLEPNFFAENSRERVGQLDNEKNNLLDKLQELIQDWENIEKDLQSISE